MTPLHWAAILGQPELVALLLKHGASNDIPSGMGRPLHVAAMSQEGVRQWLAPGIAGGHNPYQPRVGSDEDHVAVIKLLLASRADVNGRDLTMRTPLMVAVRQGNVGAVETLLAAGADLEAAEQLGFTALQVASLLDAPAPVVSNIVTRLIRAGAPLESRDLVRRTPLHQAAYDGKPVVAALLLAAGARKDAVGPDLRTPLLLAVVRGSREVFELLLAKGADTEWRDAFGTPRFITRSSSRQGIWPSCCLATVPMSTRAPPGQSAPPHSWAAPAGDLEVIKVLLDLGRRLSGRIKRLHRADGCGRGRPGGRSPALARTRRQARSRRTGGTRPSCERPKSGQLEMVKFLLERGAKLDARDKAGFTAFTRRRIAVTRKWWSFSSVVERRSTRAATSTPLHNAANGAYTNEARYVAVAKVLLAHGADVNARMREPDATAPRRRVGAPPNPPGSPCRRANPSVRDDNGKTALDLAIAGKHSECAALLRSASQRNRRCPGSETAAKNQPTALRTKAMKKTMHPTPRPLNLRSLFAASIPRLVAGASCCFESGSPRVNAGPWLRHKLAAGLFWYQSHRAAGIRRSCPNLLNFIQRDQRIHA